MQSEQSCFTDKHSTLWPICNALSEFELCFDGAINLWRKYRNIIALLSSMINLAGFMSFR